MPNSCHLDTTHHHLAAVAAAEVGTIDNIGHTAVDHIQVGYRLPVVEHYKPQPFAQIPHHTCPSDKTAYKTSSQSLPGVSPCYPSFNTNPASMLSGV
ncbi:hypothetical protein Tco_0329813 [Tanacetum coccineum]